MYTGCCIGALSLATNESIRLLERDGSNPPRTTMYEIGQVWDIDFEPVRRLRPPHTEDIKVIRKNHISNIQNVATQIISRVNRLHQGGIDELHEGFLRFTNSGSGYISAIYGVPDYSTCFWIPDRDLTSVTYGRDVKYCYSTYQRLKYVGFEQPMGLIPAETLVRVSLARWWSPPDSDDEARCYLQLSGWYL